MQVFPSDDDGSGHLCLDDLAGKDTATDRDLAGEWAAIVISMRE